MSRLSLVAVVALVLAVAGPAFAQSTPQPPVIVTQGEATLKRAPDRAWITIATDTRDPKAADARQKSAEAMRAVDRALRGTGLPADAIRTTGYSLAPEMVWNNGRSTMKGYIVHSQIEVRVDNMDKVGDVLDAANSANGVALTILGPRFDLKDQQGAETEALRLAVEAALVRAQAMATGARRSLGAILRIDEQNFRPYQPMPMAMRAVASNAQAESPDTPITPGEIEVKVQVMLTVEIR